MESLDKFAKVTFILRVKRHIFQEQNYFNFYGK